MQRSTSILWGLVIVLLILNLALLYALNLARLAAIDALSQVEATLDSLANQVIVYDIQVDQAVPMQADVPLDRTLEVPLNTVIPIDQVLSVPFETPAGEVMLDVPIKTDVPIDIVVPVDFDQTISIDTVVQLKTTLPVEIDIAQTPLAGYLKQARRDISRLRSRLALQGKAAVTDETVVVAASGDETETAAPPTSAADSQTTTVSAEAVKTSAPDPQVALKSGTTDGSQAELPAAPPSPARQGAQPDLGLCDHTYWPLRPGTEWTYNSPHTSYTQRVDGLSNHQLDLSTQYEGRDVQFGLACSQEGLGGLYLGDMRRITELGGLTFSNPRGVFLPRPQAMEEIGRTWTQEFDVTGTVPARQGDSPVTGRISHGRAVAVYAPTGIEALDTPLGPREALRVEQKLELELNIDFDLGDQTISATEVVNLSTVYWFARGIGPVKMHWQGGTIQHEVAMHQTPFSQRSPVSALAEDQLVFVCVSPEGQSPECMRMTGISQFDLTVPPKSELEVPGLVFPISIDGDVGVSTPEVETEEPVQRPPDVDQPPAEETSEDDADDNGADSDDDSDLRAYVAAVESLGERLSAAAEDFWEAALKFRNGQLTFDEFREKFLEFAPKVRALIQDINRLSPPPEAEAIHQKLTGGLGKCNQAVDLMDDWFDAPDSDTKDAAALLVAECVEDVTVAGDELRELVGGD